MDNVTIAQAALTKALEVTFHKQHEFLLEAFTNCGITVGPDGKNVAGVTNPNAVADLMKAVGSTFPVAAIAMKRVLADQGVTV